jgi:hypothetical protein
MRHYLYWNFTNGPWLGSYIHIQDFNWMTRKWAQENMTRIVVANGGSKRIREDYLLGYDTTDIYVLTDI